MQLKVLKGVTSKTAKKLASTATEKLVTKASEKIGEKSGQLIGDQIYNKFKDKEEKIIKPSNENKGEEII